METAVTSPVRSGQTDLRVTAMQLPATPTPRRSFNEPTCGSSTPRRSHTLTTAKLASTSHSIVNLQAKCAKFYGEKTRLQTSAWSVPYRHTQRFPTALSAWPPTTETTAPVHQHTGLPRLPVSDSNGIVQRKMHWKPQSTVQSWGGFNISFQK